MSKTWPDVPFREFLKPGLRPYTLAPNEDANLVGMRLYGEGPFHRELKPAMRIAKKSHFVIRSGDIIYNKLFAWKGTFGIVGPELDRMFVSDKFPTYELNRTKVDEGYLCWYFRYPPLWDQAREMSTGSAALSKLTLNPPKFLHLTIPLPPLAEQRRIVARIERVAEKIGGGRTLRQHSMKQAGTLFETGLERIVEDLTKQYELESLIDLVEPNRGISYGVVLTGPAVEAGVPTLRAGDLQKFRVLLNNVKRIDPMTEARYQRTRLRGNEVLLRIRGGLGEAATCPPQMIGGNVSREIAVIPFTERILPEYGMYVLSAPSIQQKMTSHLRGTSYVGINLKDVRTLMIPVPTLPEQHRVVAYLDNLQAKVGALKQLQAETAAELDALLPSVLDKAFKGEF